jgi:hypothetical protein
MTFLRVSPPDFLSRFPFSLKYHRIDAPSRNYPHEKAVSGAPGAWSHLLPQRLVQISAADVPACTADRRYESNLLQFSVCNFLRGLTQVQLRAGDLHRDSCIIRGYCTSGESADKICRTSVWICKEQAFSLVSRVALLYVPLLREKIRRYPVPDDSIPYQCSQSARAHWPIICQGVPLVLVNRSGVVRNFYGEPHGRHTIDSTHGHRCIVRAQSRGRGGTRLRIGRSTPIRAVRPGVGREIRRRTVSDRWIWQGCFVPAHSVRQSEHGTRRPK